MAHEILPDLPPEDKKAQKKEMIPASSSSVKKASFWDNLILFIATWQYFKWTGKAIAEGKKIPKEWMILGGAMEVKRVKEVLAKPPEAKKSAYKVVDLEAEKEVDLLKQ